MIVLQANFLIWNSVPVTPNLETTTPNLETTTQNSEMATPNSEMATHKYRQQQQELLGLIRERRVSPPHSSRSPHHHGQQTSNTSGPGPGTKISISQLQKASNSLFLMTFMPLLKVFYESFFYSTFLKQLSQLPSLSEQLWYMPWEVTAFSFCEPCTL